MENNANYALVGALATAVLVALVGFVYWFAGPTGNVATKPYDVVFTGTVSGITRGTDVQFNGIKVGQVNSLALDPNDTNRVLARIEVAANTPVKADTRVLVGFQGLTGVGSVQLAGGSQAAGDPLVAQGSTAPTLYAEPSNFQSILDGLAATVNGASTAVDRVNSILDANDTRLNATIANVETFSAALAANSEGVENFLATMSEAGEQIGPMAKEIKSLSADVRGLVDAVPPEKVAQAVANVSTFTESLARNSGQIDDFFATTSVLSKNLTELTQGLSASVAVIDQVAAEIDPAVVGRVMGNIDTFSTEANALTADLRRLLDAVPADKVASVITDAATFTNTLARNSAQLDGFMTAMADLPAKVSGLVDGLSDSVGVIDSVTAKIDPEVVGRVMANVDSFSTDINAFSTNLRGIIDAVPADKVASVVTDMATFSDTLARNSGQIDSFLTGMSGLPEKVGSVVDGLSASVAVIDQVTAGIDPKLVSRVLANVDAFSTKLGENAGSVDTIMANATSLTTQLNESAAQIDGILAKVDDVVSSAEGQGMFDQITQAAASVRALADQLNASTAGIAVGLNNFTSRGLTEYSALAAEARATLQRFDRVVRNLENNPQGLIFGGETVRDYNKR